MMMAGTALCSANTTANQCAVMSITDDFRFQSHQLLVNLDAATTHLMMLVVANELSGAHWDEAIAWHKVTYDIWAASLAAIDLSDASA